MFFANHNDSINLDDVIFFHITLPHGNHELSHCRNILPHQVHLKHPLIVDHSDEKMKIL